LNQGDGAVVRFTIFSGQEATMNAIHLLKREHEQAKRALAQILEASAGQRGGLWAKLQPELKVHEQIEEAALYGPVAQEAGSREPALQRWQQHHHTEVSELETLIREIGGLEPIDDAWMQTVGKLRLTLEHHIREEEGDIWPRIQQVWDAAKLEHAGQQMEHLKREKLPHAA
jgi:Hemerythrin HHE cation binding domain